MVRKMKGTGKVKVLLDDLGSGMVWFKRGKCDMRLFILGKEPIRDLSHSKRMEGVLTTTVSIASTTLLII